MLPRNSAARLLLDRMMECSEEQLSAAVRYGEIHQKQVASRVLESPHNFRQWESAHSQSLKPIATASTTKQQVQGVKRMALSMIHRKAPFEYLREKQIFGTARHRFFQKLYGHHDFATSVVNEHRNYLVAGASYICMERFCSEGSMQQISEYERRYTSYWGAKTARLLDESKSGNEAPPPELLGELRNDLQQRRHKVLNAALRADALTIEELRRPNGDTLRLRYTPRSYADF
ncbi:MAG: hypothetical protein ABIQ86_04590 [Steroidobacteraceae bacterium]